MRVAGVVLAGGKSRRFGREKAGAILAGRPLLAWSLAALDACCRAVVVSAAPGSQAEAIGRENGRLVVHDDPGYPSGPLAGVAAGLAWAPAGHDLMVSLPCDTPLIGAAEIDALIAAIGDAPAAYAVTAGGPQGLCAIWRTGLARRLADVLADGKHPSVHGFLEGVGAIAVGFEDLGAFRNVNTQEDLAALDRAVGARPPLA
ncbi:MAG: molybdenum cofactor guanylyltransferase [Pseudomonadota bacterium]